jgi:hypothetical protein
MPNGGKRAAGKRAAGKRATGAMSSSEESVEVMIFAAHDLIEKVCEARAAAEEALARQCPIRCVDMVRKAVLDRSEPSRSRMLEDVAAYEQDNSREILNNSREILNESDAHSANTSILSAIETFRKDTTLSLMMDRVVEDPQAAIDTFMNKRAAQALVHLGAPVADAQPQPRPRHRRPSNQEERVEKQFERLNSDKPDRDSFPARHASRRPIFTDVLEETQWILDKHRSVSIATLIPSQERTRVMDNLQTIADAGLDAESVRVLALGAVCTNDLFFLPIFA